MFLFECVAFLLTFDTIDIPSSAYSNFWANKLTFKNRESKFTDLKYYSKRT